MKVTSKYQVVIALSRQEASSLAAILGRVDTSDPQAALASTLHAKLTGAPRARGVAIKHEVTVAGPNGESTPVTPSTLNPILARSLEAVAAAEAATIARPESNGKVRRTVDAHAIVEPVDGVTPVFK